MDNTLYWVWFQIMFGYGSPRSHDLLNAFESPKKLYDLVEDDGDYNILTLKEKGYFGGSFNKAEKIVETTLKKKCTMITPDSDDYPDKLQHIYGKPSVLYVRGDISVLKDKLAFTVVGARESSEYGKKATEVITEGLIKAGATIISGLARGIDSVALETAIDNRGSAIGVLACGLDYDYPKNSSELKRGITQNGAVITEYPLGTVPRPGMFPTRNRIMSGMSDGVVVIEASDKSGALITANTAFEQNREVYVVPGEIFSGKFLGSHKLVKNGTAKLINSPAEILLDYPKFSNILLEGKKIKRTEKVEIETKLSRKRMPDGMDEIFYLIYENIDETNKTSDQIAIDANVEIANVLGAVTTLEILGLIKCLPGGFFTLD